MRRNSAAFAILVGGGIAGVLDITYAIVFWGLHGVPASRILQSVASGLLGAASFKGGTSTAALGLLLHFVIALSWAAIFYLASRRFRILTDRAVPSGILYGVFVFAAMNLVVVPLSATAHRTRFPLLPLTTDLLSHMFFVGLPIALATRRASRTAR